MRPMECGSDRASQTSSEPLTFSLLASSTLSIAFVLARVLLTGRNAYVFLLWNSFLAWIPYVLAHVLAARHRRSAHTLELFALGAVFVGFLPNAPYMVTDLMHLHGQGSVPYWFDTLMLMSFAWSGLTLGVASVRRTAAVVRARTKSSTATYAYVVTVSVLTAFGIYLGRFLRLNTWDAAVHPFTVARSVAAPVVHPTSHPHAWMFTAAFTAFFLASYASFTRRRTCVR